MLLALQPHLAGKDFGPHLNLKPGLGTEVTRSLRVQITLQKMRLRLPSHGKMASSWSFLLVDVGSVTALTDRIGRT